MNIKELKITLRKRTTGTVYIALAGGVTVETSKTRLLAGMRYSSPNIDVDHDVSVSYSDWDDAGGGHQKRTVTVRFSS